MSDGWVQKYGSTRVVSEAERKVAPIDLLQRAEESVLSELVMRVHHDRRIGTHWPTVLRYPMKWDGGKLEDATPETATEWQVRAVVYTVPRG